MVMAGAGRAVALNSMLSVVPSAVTVKVASHLPALVGANSISTLPTPSLTLCDTMLNALFPLMVAVAWVVPVST